MPTPDLISSLTDLGGLGLFVGFVVLATYGLFRQLWVPGWLYKRERERRLEAEGEVAKQAATVAKLTRQLQNERRRRRTDASPPR